MRQNVALRTKPPEFTVTVGVMDRWALDDDCTSSGTSSSFFAIGRVVLQVDADVAAGRIGRDAVSALAIDAETLATVISAGAAMVATL
jgi:hypothetical protein